MALRAGLTETPQDLEAVYRFRYNTYVEEFNLKPPEADHPKKILRDDLDDICKAYALFDDEKIVGSLRLLFFEDASDFDSLIKKYDCKSSLDTFGPSAICATSRFMLSPHLRHGRSIFKLMEVAYRDACKHGNRFNYGDCSPHILPFYEHLGYRRYTQAYNDTSYGYKLPILMLIRDLERFKRVRSPLTRIAAEYKDDTELRNWFEKTYPEYLDIESAAFLSEDGFFDMLSARVGTDPLHSLSLLRGMDRAEADHILKMATLIKSHNGDKIIRQGERDKTLYVMLNGVAEVILNDAPDKPVTILAAGDTFGEVGLVAETPRTANVIAKSDCEVLVISGDFLERCLRKEPATAAKLLLNLSRILAERLSVTTAQLTKEAL